MRWIAFLCALFFSIVCPTALSRGAGYGQLGDVEGRYKAWLLVEQSVDELRKGHTTSAMEDVDRALADWPDDPQAYYLRGCCFQIKQKLEAAKADYTRTISLPGPQKKYALLNRAVCNQMLHDMPEARADVNQLLAMYPKFAPAYFMRSTIEDESGDLRAALSDLNQAVSLSPKSGSLLIARGELKKKMGDARGAQADLKESARYGAKIDGFYNNRSIFEAGSGDLAAEKADLDSAIASNPGSWAASLNRANLRYKEKDFAGALSDVDRAIILRPKDAKAYVLRGVIEATTQSIDSALSDINRAIDLDSGLRGLYGQRATLEERKFDLNHALSDADRAVSDDPDHPQLFVLRGCIHLELGQLEAAASDYLCAIKIAERSADGVPDSKSDYGHIYLWASEALQNKPDANANLASYRARAKSGTWSVSVIDYLLGNLHDDQLLAKAASEDAQKDKDQHCEAWYYVGLKAQLDGRTAQAKEDFQRCMATREIAFYEYSLAQGELQSQR